MGKIINFRVSMVAPFHVVDYFPRTTGFLFRNGSKENPLKKLFQSSLKKQTCSSKVINVKIFGLLAFSLLVGSWNVNQPEIPFLTQHFGGPNIFKCRRFHFFFWNAARSKALTGGGVLITLILPPTIAVALQNKSHAPFITRAALMLNEYAKCQPASVIQL